MKTKIDINQINWKKCDNLIPTIIQDIESKQVLTLTYSTKESLNKLLKTGDGWYYSRSRNELWNKGSTSGNTQKVISIAKDCDNDAILVKIKQKGVACHTGSYSCFGEREFSIEKLYDVIKNRKDNPKEGSYTTSLFQHRKGENKILEKIGEEANELILAAKDNDRKETIYEAGDLIYHLLVLLAQKDMTWDDIVKELEKREK